VGVSPLQLVHLHRNRRYFVRIMSILIGWPIYNTLTSHGLARLLRSIVYKYRILTSPAFQPCKYVCSTVTWFCLSYFLKTNIKYYCIYQYFMSINSFFNTVSVSRYSRLITVTRDLILSLTIVVENTKIVTDICQEMLFISPFWNCVVFLYHVHLSHRKESWSHTYVK
jgi:hypothetical protein